MRPDADPLRYVAIYQLYLLYPLPIHAEQPPPIRQQPLEITLTVLRIFLYNTRLGHYRNSLQSVTPWSVCLAARFFIANVACQRGYHASHGPHTFSHGKPRSPMGYCALPWETTLSRNTVRLRLPPKITLAKHTLPWDTAVSRCPAHANIYFLVNFKSFNIIE